MIFEGAFLLTGWHLSFSMSWVGLGKTGSDFVGRSRTESLTSPLLFSSLLFSFHSTTLNS